MSSVAIPPMPSELRQPLGTDGLSTFVERLCPPRNLTQQNDSVCSSDFNVAGVLTSTMFVAEKYPLAFSFQSLQLKQYKALLTDLHFNTHCMHACSGMT